MGSTEWDYHVGKLELAQKIVEDRMKKRMHQLTDASEEEYFGELERITRKARKLVDDAFPTPQCS